MRLLKNEVIQKSNPIPDWHIYTQFFKIITLFSITSKLERNFSSQNVNKRWISTFLIKKTEKKIEKKEEKQQKNFAKKILLS